MSNARVKGGSRRRTFVFLLAGTALLGGVLVGVPPGTPASAEDGPTLSGQVIAAAAPVQTAPGQSAAPDAVAPAAPVNFKINRPTVPDAEYAASKAAAAKVAAGPKPAEPSAPTSGAPLALGTINFVGDEQGGPGGGWTPPDTDGATGNNQYTEVTNADVRVWDLVGPTQIKHVSLTSHFGNASQPYFDPTVIYHPIYNRWITLAPQFPNGAGTSQLLSFSVSNSPNAAGGYCTYTIDTVGLYGVGSFFDYPHIGFDHDSFYITANIFNPGFVGATTLIWPLAEMTSCLGMTGQFFSGLNGTLSPPRVYDRNPRSFLVSFQGSSIAKYTVRDSGSFPVELTGPVSIPITAQSGPPDATQNSSIDRLDTLDGRFVNGSLQIGNLLYQVNSTALGSFAAVRWYKLDTSTNTAIKQCTVFASGTSHDFNPSIAANGSGDVFLNWSASKVSATANVQARAAGAEATDLTATCPAMTQVVYGSGPEYGNGNATSEVLRWGDYSSVYLKFNTKRALVVNQLVAASGGTGVGTSWTSKIAQIQFA